MQPTVLVERKATETTQPSNRKHHCLAVILLIAAIATALIFTFDNKTNGFNFFNASSISKLPIDDDFPLCESLSGLGGVGCGLVEYDDGEFCLSNCIPDLECIFAKEGDTRSICSRPNPSRSIGLRVMDFKGGSRKRGKAASIIFDGKARQHKDNRASQRNFDKRGLHKRALNAVLGQPFQSAAFVDVTTGSLSTLTSANTASGLKNYFLGFVVATSVTATTQPTFNGNLLQNYVTTVNGLKSQGYGIIVSFGGAAGTFIENTNGMTGEKMASWISQVIDLFGLTRIDMDIESAPAYFENATNTRLDALKRVRNKYPNLIISATVPVDYNGIFVLI